MRVLTGWDIRPSNTLREEEEDYEYEYIRIPSDNVIIRNQNPLVLPAVELCSKCGFIHVIEYNKNKKNKNKNNKKKKNKKKKNFKIYAK